MTPESKVKKRVTALLKARGAYYFTPVTGGFGTSGVPDIVACYKGKFLGIECKAGSRQPTALQLKNLEDIQKNGGESLVVREDTIDLLEELLNLLGETK
jgi:Holliday junction resolvase